MRGWAMLRAKRGRPRESRGRYDTGESGPGKWSLAEEKSERAEQAIYSSLRRTRRGWRQDLFVSRRRVRSGGRQERLCLSQGRWKSWRSR